MEKNMTEKNTEIQRENHSRRPAVSYAAALAGFIAAVLLDQLTKYWAAASLKGNEPFVIIKGVFELRYLENRGAAFGLMQNMQIVFVIGAVAVIAAVLFLYGKMPPAARFLPLRVCAVLLCAGAVGNMIDRLRLNYVIDFFYFRLIDFPIFNVADIYVSVGTAALAVLILFYYKCKKL